MSKIERFLNWINIFKRLKYLEDELLSQSVKLKTANRMARANVKEIGSYKEIIANLSTMGIDLHTKHPSWIVVCTSLKGGQMRIIRTDFKNMKELDETVKNIRSAYGIPRDRLIADTPYGYNTRDFF